MVRPSWDFGYEYLRAFHDLQMVIYGLAILTFVIFLPNGLVTIKERILSYWIDRRGAISEAEDQ